MTTIVWTRAEIGAAVALVATLDAREWEPAEARAVIEKARATADAGGYMRLARR